MLLWTCLNDPGDGVQDSFIWQELLQYHKGLGFDSEEAGVLTLSKKLICGSVWCQNEYTDCTTGDLTSLALMSRLS